MRSGEGVQTNPKESGKPSGRMAEYLYIVLFLLLCLVTFAGLASGKHSGADERADMTGFPSVTAADGGVNLEYLQQAGNWFQEHFAFRQELVTANAKLYSALFHESASDQVIQGTDGWLYYRDSLADYQGTDLMTDRALYDIAHTAAMTQNYCSLFGIDYLFALAPNKATIYPEHMPYYLRPHASGQSNRTRLASFMEQEQVAWLDLSERLKEAKENGEARALPELYHRTDSHWTAEGAAIAAKEILSRLHISGKDYGSAEYVVRKDFSGDLERMLYPAAARPEEEVYYDPSPSYGYVDEVESTFDYYIHTVSGGAGGSLVMYRDSFGNAILPFLAEAFESAFFTRGIPYTLTDLYECDASAAVFLRAERFLPELAERPPVLEAMPLTDLTEETAREELSQINAEMTSALEDANPYYSRIEGVLEKAPKSGERIFAAPGDGSLYEAMPLHRKDGKEGFVLYLPAEKTEKLPDAASWEIYLGSKTVVCY